MKAEKVILSFVAVLIGLIAAGIAFYLYQTTQKPNSPQIKNIAIVPSPTAAPLSDSEHLFKIDNPKNEGVFDKKLIKVSGKTVKGATIIISTEDGDQVVTPAGNGDFTLTQTIPDGTTIVQFVAIFPDGTEKKETRTVTFSTETF